MAFLPHSLDIFQSAALVDVGIAWRFPSDTEAWMIRVTGRIGSNCDSTRKELNKLNSVWLYIHLTPDASVLICIGCVVWCCLWPW